MIEKIKEFILRAGQYSLEKRGRQQHQLDFKWGDEAVSSMVTEVDVAISRMFKEFVSENFSHLNYMVIDEESIAELGGNVFTKAAQSEYQFVIDPIDGTINYAADVPLYGVLIAVMKNCKPLYGFIYAPALGELVYCDDENVYFEHNGVKEIIEPKQKTSSRIVQGHAWSIDLKENHFNGHLVMQDYFSAVIYFMYVILGRVKGVFVRANLWDVAPAMAICKRLGMGFYDYNTKEEMSEFSARAFSDKCKVNNVKIVCFPEDFDEIKQISRGLRT